MGESKPTLEDFEESALCRNSAAGIRSRPLCFVGRHCSRIRLGIYFVRQGGWLRWSPTGYVEKDAPPSDQNVAVLTPEPIVLCLRNGPEIHHSACAL